MAIRTTIDAGRLNRRVVFKKPVSSLNNEGGQEVTYSPEVTTLAFVTKFIQSRATEAENTALTDAFDFYIRWNDARSEIDKDWLIEYKGNDYVIHLIETIDQEPRFLRFTAKSRGTSIS